MIDGLTLRAVSCQLSAISFQRSANPSAPGVLGRFKLARVCARFKLKAES
jgi:hypothetical protein